MPKLQALATRKPARSSFSPRRIYLLPGEVLHPHDCAACATVANAIRLDRVQRRVIPERVLEPAGVLEHLEHDVLGRPVGFGDPIRLAQEQLASVPMALPRGAV